MSWFESIPLFLRVIIFIVAGGIALSTLISICVLIGVLGAGTSMALNERRSRQRRRRRTNRR